MGIVVAIPTIAQGRAVTEPRTGGRAVEERVVRPRTRGPPTPRRSDRFLRRRSRASAEALRQTQEIPRSETRSLVGSAYCSTRPSTPRQQKHVTPLEALRRRRPQEPVEILRSSRSSPTSWRPYADERRAEKKDEPHARAGDPTDPAPAANQVIAPIPEIRNVALRALALCRVET